MTADTQPVIPPATVTARRWLCHVCGAMGSGGVDGFHDHYMSHHYNDNGRGPSPTEPGRDGRPRLSPRFDEWMMGLPAGWVTDCDIPRAAQLKALGNGVVPAQAALALRLLLGVAS